MTPRYARWHNLCATLSALAMIALLVGCDSGDETGESANPTPLNTVQRTWVHEHEFTADPTLVAQAHQVVLLDLESAPASREPIENVIPYHLKAGTYTFCLDEEDERMTDLVLENNIGERVVELERFSACVQTTLPTGLYTKRLWHDGSTIPEAGSVAFVQQTNPRSVLDPDTGLPLAGWWSLRPKSSQFAKDSQTKQLNAERFRLFANNPVLSIANTSYTKIAPLSVQLNTCGICFGRTNQSTLFQFSNPEQPGNYRARLNLDQVSDAKGYHPKHAEYWTVFTDGASHVKFFAQSDRSPLHVHDLGNFAFSLSVTRADKTEAPLVLSPSSNCLPSTTDAPGDCNWTVMVDYANARKGETYDLTFDMYMRWFHDGSVLTTLQEGEVALFEKCNYTGNAWIFSENIPSFHEIGGSLIALGCCGINTYGSSLKLGDNTTVTLYRSTSYKGTHQTFIKDTACLDGTTIGSKASSSLKIGTATDWLVSSRKCEGCKLMGLELTGLNLQGVDLKGADLSGAILDKITLADANLDNANLTGASMQHTTLVGATLAEAQFDSHTNFTGANVSGVDLSGAALSGARFSDAILSGVDLKGADLSGAIFDGAELSDAILAGAQFDSHTDFTDANLQCADFSGTKNHLMDLTDIILTDVTFHPAPNDTSCDTAPSCYANFAYTILDLETLPVSQWRYIDLSHATIHNLQGADLSTLKLCYAILSGVNLYKVNLEEVNLDHAEVIGANLASTNLKGASMVSLQAGVAAGSGEQITTFSDAYMPDVDLTGADLRSANLSNVRLYRHLKTTSLDGARLDSADFAGATLFKVRFGADGTKLASLNDTVFNKAVLINADFQGASLTNAKFDGAYLQGADFSTASMASTSFKNALFFGDTGKGHCTSTKCTWTYKELDGTTITLTWTATTADDVLDGSTLGQIATSSTVVCPNGNTGGCNKDKLTPETTPPFPPPSNDDCGIPPDYKPCDS